jgi:hypothetical protein
MPSYRGSIVRLCTFALLYASRDQKVVHRVPVF